MSFNYHIKIALALFFLLEFSDAQTCTCELGDWLPRCYYDPFNKQCFQIRDEVCTDACFIDPQFKRRREVEKREKKTCNPCVSTALQVPVCGDGMCNGIETCLNCPEDCQKNFEGIAIPCDQNSFCKSRENGVRMGAITIHAASADAMEKMLDVLASNKVKATFFVAGEDMPRLQKAYQRAIKEGHAVANFGLTNRTYSTLYEPDIVQELLTGEKIIDAVVSKRSRFMRVPLGEYSTRIDAILKKVSMTPVYWTYDTNEWRDSDVPAIYSRMQEFYLNGTAWPGFIHLAYGLRSESADILLAAISVFKTLKVDLVTIDECLGMTGKLYKNEPISLNGIASINPTKSNQIIIAPPEAQYYKAGDVWARVSGADRNSVSSMLIVFWLLYFIW